MHLGVGLLLLLPLALQHLHLGVRAALVRPQRRHQPLQMLFLLPTTRELSLQPLQLCAMGMQLIGTRRLELQPHEQTTWQRVSPL